MTAPARLGSTTAPVEHDPVRFGLSSQPQAVLSADFVDWTVDGVHLRELFLRGNPKASPLDESTLIPPSGPLDEAAAGRLRALLGEDAECVFPGGRVGILFCDVCGGLDCPTLSAEVVMDGDTVTWRDIAFQTDWEPFSLADQFGVTVTFARDQYEATIRELLARP